MHNTFTRMSTLRNPSPILFPLALHALRERPLYTLRSLTPRAAPWSRVAGAVLLIPEDKVLLRTIIALLVSLFALVATGAAKPFRGDLDDFLYAVSQLVLVVCHRTYTS